MPTYQYLCKSCGHGFEMRLRMSQSSDPQNCPDCGGAETRKRIGAIALNGVSHTAFKPQPMAARPPSSPFT
ncbi:MAG: zinc ribbon domain-containing protein [Methylococcales bacterium]|nr:zinc ribbon domain-containing protein [Methylococcales bacterium]